MFVDFLYQVFREHAAKTAIVWQDRLYSYSDLLDSIVTWREQLNRHQIRQGDVVTLEADFCPDSVAALVCLIERACIVVPMATSVEGNRNEFLRVSQAGTRICIADHREVSVYTTGYSADHPLLKRLGEAGRPGLVLFSSGSTGESKAILHDFSSLIEKFKVRRPSHTTMAFLLFDHIGGLNTLLHVVSNGGTLVVVGSRNPDAVCAAIEEHGVRVLPTSPTFLNFLMMSEAYRRHDLSSLELVTYGTEAMPESILRRFRSLFPTIELKQTYGLSELGILRSKSKDSDSLWVRIGGEGYQVRVVDGMVEIKADSAMLGYLNAPSPFTDDGWFKTGDNAEVDGDYMLIKGRASEMVNVGGEKVHPAEVESVLLEMDNVIDVTVRGEPNPLMGQTVSAYVTLVEPEEPRRFRVRVREFCKGRLAAYKIPARVEVTTESQTGSRFKKIRRTVAP